jgi:urea carboxylase-associated protein 2
VSDGPTDTGTTRAAREHARAQAGTAAAAMPTLPASSWPSPPDGVDPTALTWAETIAGGGYSSKVLSRGTTVRLTDLEGDACAHLLLYNADQSWERLNVADTVKIPWQAYLGEGHPLLSDQGRILGVIVGDTSGRHDALCGTTALATNEERYGDGSPQGPSAAGRELQLLAAAKHGLGPRDIPPSISFFQGVRVDGEGALRFEGSAGAGAAVELRIEMPVIAIVANVPHPLDPRPEYTATTLELLAWRGDPTGPEDALWSQTPELERAFLNTQDYSDARRLR